MKDTRRAGLKSLEVERNVANLHHYAEHSRHHTKDKQRFVVSVVAYDSAPGHHFTEHSGSGQLRICLRRPARKRRPAATTRSATRAGS